MLLILFFLTLPLFLSQQEPPPVTCVITKVAEVTCDEGKRQPRSLSGVDTDEWRWSVKADDTNWAFPLERRGRLSVGRVVKAVIIHDRLYPVASCEVRVWRQVNEWRELNAGYGPMPHSISWAPEDCVEHSEFIKSVLAKLKSKEKF